MAGPCTLNGKEIQFLYNKRGAIVTTTLAVIPSLIINFKVLQNYGKTSEFGSRTSADFPLMEKKTHHGDEMFVFSAIGLSF